LASGAHANLVKAGINNKYFRHFPTNTIMF
jgi:hypothetical protein